MAKIWMDAGTFLEKTIDIEDMFELNLRAIRKRNEKIKMKLRNKKYEDSEIKLQIVVDQEKL
ncbi:putative phage protein [Clostridioides difficile F152]|uniref:hypothetical protein n=1 Tax=Clostridioides difficile TaxID=1496 RepID=UPI00038C80E5|nr:hypothetical protein [Clostridioides difficile]EQH87060.1 putative phage protein [Clostridioides difficile F152]